MLIVLNSFKTKLFYFKKTLIHFYQWIFSTNTLHTPPASPQGKTAKALLQTAVVKAVSDLNRG